jgi:hypothetical protein
MALPYLRHMRCIFIGTKLLFEARNNDLVSQSADLVHRRFDLIRRVWDARSQQLGALFSNEVHVFQEKALTVDRGDRLEVDRGSFPKWPNWKTGK